MKPLVWVSGAALLSFVLFCTGSKPVLPPVTEEYQQEYQQAVAAAERVLQERHYNRVTMTLVALRKTLSEPVNLTPQERAAAHLGGQWEVEYLNKDCLGDRGLRSCKGGRMVVTVNLRTNRAEVHGLE